VVSGRVEAAIRQSEMGRGLPGGGAPVLAGLLGHAYGLAGRTEDARAELQRLQLAAARGYVPAEYRVLVHLGLGDHDRALAALEEAFQNRSGGIAYLKADPILDPIRDDPRFQAIVRRAGL
jgi:Flp pilus assembly protein TadD